MTETVGTGAGSAPGEGGTPTGGLTVRRVFTTDGVHPYDQVTWEQRDVVMTNWRDGTVNFEQRGVEFPDFWSVNATNIVTSKYFRGAVGTPAREKSLKQLIDRVVKTYVKAGRDHGYFATSADLEIFEHELTWMLLHQVFSFNSPVWFNVGTPSKQQVSACQPYDALVSTPAGAKPIGELVEFDAVGEKVYDAHGLTTIVATKSNGTKEVLRVTTKSGHVLDVTADHLVWRAAASGGRFVAAGELRPGDKLEWHRRYSYGESEIDETAIAEAARAGRDHDGAVIPALHDAPLPVVAAYLSGVFERFRAQGDCVEVRVADEKLVRGVQVLLARFGIFATVTGADGTWTVSVEDAGDRRIFADEIGFLDPVKTAKLEASFEKPGRPALERKRLEIASIESRGEMPVYDIQTESGEYLSGNLRVHNCFILAVDDTMESILNWYREEGLIFKGGSGAGLNLSRIRSSKELLTSGGTASGPVSFMRGADASAGTIKSGGATRRAAKMVVLDVDHPDVEEFIQTKAREEEKIKVLRDAGFDMDLSGADISSVQYQNANNSVRVSDEFMQAVENASDFGLRARLTGEVIERVDAKKLFRGMAQAAWECADPGIQYDGTINDWHTCPESGRITASNPCFPSDQRVVTDAGLVRIGDLVVRAARGETFAVYTNEVTNKDAPAARIVATQPTRYMITGTNEIVELRFSDGSRLRCTPNHRVWTENQGWVHADKLTEADKVVRSIEHAPRPYASAALPVLARQAVTRARGTMLRAVPEKWDVELAHYVGWLVGDGCLTGAGAVTVYGTAWEQENVLPRHRALLTSITGFESKPSRQQNGTVQLRANRNRFALLLGGLGVVQDRSAEKVVPESIYQAPEDIVTAFLRGLFDADGCVVNQTAKGTRYVGLGSRSEELLIGVQELLVSLGIRGRIYRTDKQGDSFEYTTKSGEVRTYGQSGPSFDLRITGTHMATFAELVGFDHAAKAEKLAEVLANHEFYVVDETVRLVSRVSQGFETTFNLTEPRNHSYIVGGTVVANCSEYMHLDNSSCNLASLNLLKFVDNGRFDAQQFARAVEFVITAMDISICFADFPTEAIGDTTRKFRQLGIGYANLGALLMALGHAYDSDGGRALAGAITSLMTGVSYRRSAELAEAVGAYEGYARNAEAHQRVMRKHAAANELVRTYHENDATVRALATEEWKRGIEIGARHGWRNSQASVLAPTGCLTADTLVTTDRGLARLSELGDLYGDRWQDVEFTVATDEGPRRATKFFVNGEEPTRRIETKGGYRIQGTLAHRVKVVDPETGAWVWKRLADIEQGDVVPMQLGGLVGDRRRVPLPVLDQAYYAGDRDIRVPDEVDADLAELVGYFEGDGSLHAKGIRLCVADTDLDVVERLRVLSKGLFGLEPTVGQREGYQEVTLQSIRLARWWQAAGFAKDLPGADHVGKGWTPRVPASIRETNDPEIYAAFLRGVFEADGTVLDGVPSVSTSSALFAEDLRTLLLALGMATTTRRTTSGFNRPILQVRLRNVDHAMIYDELVGFMSERKARLVVCLEPRGSGKRDWVHLPREVWDELVPFGHELRGAMVQSLRKTGGVARMLARRVYSETFDPRLGRALKYLFEAVASNEDGGAQPTYDLSVPENVTYVANGFVSHNTIGFMMDCDTTGIEPDFSLVKFKKLVGGGSMQIVNQTVPRALAALGYQPEQVEAIVEYVSQHGHVVDAPGLRPEHYEVFDCAVGDRSIAPMGHVRMMAAVQPFLSGAISKTVNMPESATVEEVENIYFQGWKLGLKALAIYRDNCKVGQPLSTGKKDKAEAEPEKVVEYRPVRRRLPKKRPSQTVSFTVGGAEGYLTAGSYPDDGLGEIFIKLGKQGSTLAGVMDAFSMSISVGLQHGIPLEFYVSKFSNLRFEPAGMTDDPDIRIATSVMDYLFRRLALDYLPYEKRIQLGILSADERAAEVEASYGGPSDSVDIEALRSTVDSTPEPKPEPAKEAHSTAELMELHLGKAADAPLCMTCGTKMRPAGSCYACEGCGATSGCS